MAQDRRQSERMLQDARLQVKEALAKHEKSFILEGHGRGHAVHNFTAKDDAKVEVGDHVHYTINNYADEQSKKVSKEAGVGKSALTTIIIRHILKIRKEMAPERNIGLAYVYCDYANKEQSALDYVGALLCQLISLSDEVSPEVTALYNDHKPGSSPLRPLLEGYELVLGAEVSRFDSVYIIVDALDECRDDDEGEFQSSTKVRVSETFGKLGETVHLLFTSREEHPPTSLTDRRVPIATMKVTATDEDIRTYVRAQIKRRESLKCYMDTELGEMIEIVITRKAAGMFLPAKLYMETLASKAGLRRGKKTIADALKNLPQFNHTQILESYQKAYQEILKNIWNQSPPRVERARQVLSWVIFTREPTNLTLPVLQRALSLQDADDTVDQGLEPTDAWEHTPDSGSEDDFEAYLLSDFDDGSSGSSTSTRGDVVPKETLLSVCRGLITMDKDTKLIRLVHYTARDYFSNENVRADLFPHAQNQLTRSCMTSLISAGADHPFDQYSHRQWGHHAQPVEREFQTEILDLVRDQKRIMRSEEIKAEDSGGWTVMNWAVVGGSKTLVQLLFQREKDLLSNEIAFLAVGSRNHMVKTDTIDARDGEISLGASLTLKAGLSFTKALPRAVRPNASDDVVRFLMENIPTESIDVKRPGDERTLLSVVAENWQWGYVGILLERVGGATLSIQSSSAIETLMIVEEASVVLSGKPSIQSLVTADKSRIEIREASVIERLDTHGESRAIIHGSSRIQRMVGLGMSTLTIDAQAKIENLTTLNHCVVQVGGDSQVQEITGLDETTLIITAKARVEQMHITDGCTAFSNGNSSVSAAMGTGTSVLTLMGQSFIERFLGFHTCAVISEGEAKVYFINCTGHSFVLMKGRAEIRQISTQDEAIVLAEGEANLTTALGMGNSRLALDGDTKIETIFASGGCMVTLRGRSKLTTMSSQDHSVFTFDGDVTIANVMSFDRDEVHPDGSASGLTTPDDPLAVDERDWRRINEQGDRVVERGRAAWISAQEKMTEGEERRKKADEIQRRDEEWSWEPTGEEPDVFYWKWPLGSS
ncbi:hypothetical protein BHE90_012925 [Fusarium euwallaceae]|uniref:Nephrocystin 3-like N-terminal domain-containing protein n=1 Tax=Fusarium euwallaceae TaxID=1147111 RepID=A0A430LAE4_9HYPO|nr:hypothetical protein BHE90_012925 [Fusarium euwallaceae]